MKPAQVRTIFFQGSSLEVLNDDAPSLTEPPVKRRKIGESSEAVNDPNFVTITSDLFEFVHVEDGNASGLNAIDLQRLPEMPVNFTLAGNVKHQKTPRSSCQCHACLRNRHDLTGGVIFFLHVADVGEFPVAIPHEDVHETVLRLYGSRTGAKFDLVWRLVKQATASSSVFLKVDVRWETSDSAAIYSKQWKADSFLQYAISTLLHADADSGSSMMPKDLYGSTFIPSRTADNAQSLQELTEMKSELLPFQNRAVHWLLHREHCRYSSETGSITAFPRQKPMPVYFQQARDYHGHVCYVSVLLGRVTKNEAFVATLGDYLSGGILAEEMGLGKTVEMIALICLNKRNAEPAHPTEKIKSSKTTLVITPPALLSQWESELQTHAPHLSVMIYDGIKGLESQEEVTALTTVLIDHDVILMTYNVLSSEVHYSYPTPTRLLRSAKRYELKRSPLVEVHWHRVVLDEAQMVESTTSHMAKLAVLLPRRHAWAVSGTPVRKDMKDVQGLLGFLRYEPFSDKHVWDRLITSCRTAFTDVFQSICIRHTKGQVHDEIALPPQQRFVVTIPFTKVEEEHYQELFRQMCADCDFNQDGSPGSEESDPESPTTITKMRNWLLRLRQSCSHPDIGFLNRRGYGMAGGPLRTVEEVLEAMIEQNQRAIDVDERNHILSKLKQGLLLATMKQSKEALDIWTIARTRTTEIVDDARREMQRQSGSKDAKNCTLFADDSSARIQDDDDTEPDAAIEARQKATTHLRHALELQHGAVFFSGNAYFQMKDNVEITEPDSEQFKQLEAKEVELYDEAKLIRKELLSDASGKAVRQMNVLADKARAQAFVEVPDLQELSTRGGIEIRSLLERTETIFSVINAQSEVIDLWREELIQKLLKRLVDNEAEDVELQGDEIDVTGKDQEQVFVYMTGLRTIIADRTALITGEKNFLIESEAKQMKALAEAGEGPDPEKLVQLLKICETLKKPLLADSSLRGIVSEMRSKVSALREIEAEGSRRAAVEKALAEDCLRRLQAIVSSQLKVSTALEAELGLYRTTTNAKIEYYKQLQRLSDAVADFEDLQNPEEQLGKITKAEPRLLQQIATKKSRHRYLLNLRKENVNAAESAMCVICQTEFQTGALTICGHQFCKDCILAWWREHRSCPLCKKRLTRGDFHPITLKPKELRVRELGQDTSQSGFAQSVYSGVSSAIMDEIRNIELSGSFGTKINTITRHLLWLRTHKPGTKSVIFSQRQQFLRILMDAFKVLKINFASLRESRGVERFRTDPNVECFLLDAAQHSSGLNLTTASNVFLCEPLINTAVELQAIARVHRIGQKQATTVWVYVINGTVEESIFEIASSRRAKYLKSGKAGDTTEKALEELDTLEFQKKSISDMLTRQGGESVDKEDLWACLFQKINASFVPDPNIDREVLRELQARAIEIRKRE